MYLLRYYIICMYIIVSIYLTISNQTECDDRARSFLFFFWCRVHMSICPYMYLHLSSIINPIIKANLLRPIGQSSLQKRAYRKEKESDRYTHNYIYKTNLVKYWSVLLNKLLLYTVYVQL